jgi:endonuclease YncB( thermonuclease family)
MRSCLLALALAFGAAAAQAAELSGRVIAIADGDTFVMLTDNNQQVRVRLNEIDAPESAQPYGLESKKALSALVMSRYVRVVDNGRDEYGRTLGRVYYDSEDINAEMVRRGAAWAYRHYLIDRSLLADEDAARGAKRGLWSRPTGEIVPPWDWRHRPQPKQAALPRLYEPERRYSAQQGKACEAKRYCRQMSSCQEAQFYLNACGVSSLDGDDDGIACEDLCRKERERAGF